MKVVVFGSINMDMVVTAGRLPRAGETLVGHRFFTAPGGKGANQAVAAARLGAETVLVGRVGGDAFGASLLENLAANGVAAGRVIRDPETISGVAAITVNNAGENCIVIVPGANGRVGAEDARQLADLIAPGDVLLLQLEIPLAAVTAAARIAARRKATVILDPAPAQPLPNELLALVDILTPNETEAATLSGVAGNNDRAREEALRRLHRRGSRQILLKMGAAGALWSSDAGTQRLPGFRVMTVDTVAAGDACNGGLAAGLCAGLKVQEALRWAMAAGALATTRHGAQEAMPARDALLQLISSQAAGDE